MSDRKDKKKNQNDEREHSCAVPETDYMQNHMHNRMQKTAARMEAYSEFRKRLARSLAAERMMLRMSQQELADRIGTKRSNISRMESGKQNLSVDYVSMVADALDKDISFIIKEKGLDYGDSTVYALKLYDEELLRFSMSRPQKDFSWQDEDALDYAEQHKELNLVGLTLKLLSVNEQRKYLLPLDLELSDQGLIKWMDRRTIPGNRELAGRILSSLGLHIDDLKGIIDISLGLSLNDSYWITPLAFSGAFSEYNLYENRFDSALSMVAYTGYGSNHGKFRTSPELTTGGMLRKAWRYSDTKGIWLYKSGTDGFANSGNEPYSEFYASQIAECMGLHAVRYELENWHHILASKCRLFTDIDTSYVPAGGIIKDGGINACLKYYKDLGEEFYQELVSMLVFDALIYNEDRHFGNFGLMRDNHSGKIVSPAPIFDNGISLLCYGMKDDLESDLEKYAAERTNPYGSGNDYLTLCSSIIGKTQKQQLRKMIGFRFCESNVSNPPSWRTRALEELLQIRVRELLAL